MVDLRAILFDLDNTLLLNDMETFIPAYLELISGYAAEIYDPELFVRHMLAATEVMAGNTDPGISNEMVFWGTFSKLTGWDREKMVPFFAHFYETEFEGLKTLTAARPEARPVTEWAFETGHRVVIATNPMFPRIATEKRLEWADLGVDEFNYALVTTYENMHATKPHREYYVEILERVDCEPRQALMVGDDWGRDIRPAAAMGMHTYWVDPPDGTQSAVGREGGSLSDLPDWLRNR
jgi:HAD superfamily hydrolase (TIGR01549 family)